MGGAEWVHGGHAGQPADKPAVSSLAAQVTFAQAGAGGDSQNVDLDIQP